MQSEDAAAPHKIRVTEIMLFWILLVAPPTAFYLRSYRPDEQATDFREQELLLPFNVDLYSWIHGERHILNLNMLTKNLIVEAKRVYFYRRNVPGGIGYSGDIQRKMCVIKIKGKFLWDFCCVKNTKEYFYSWIY